MKGVFFMSVSSVAKGVTIGITAGAVAYAFANASSKEKRRMKSNAGRAIHAIGNLVEGFNMMMK